MFGTAWRSPRRACGRLSRFPAGFAGSVIPLHERERIFERFVRLDTARTASAGAGLGLPIARWIAQRHGGTLAVGERDGGGSVFTFEMTEGAQHAPAGRSRSEGQTDRAQPAG